MKKRVPLEKGTCFFCALCDVLFDVEVFDDEFLALGGVFAHVVFQEVADGAVFADDDGFQAHVFADEAFEFFGADFAQAFEAGDLGVFAQFGDGGLLFGFVVAVEGLFFVADAEEGGLEDVDVALPDEIGEELEEEGEEQQADVHAVDVGIGGDDDAVVTQVFDAVFDVEGVLEEVEFLVFVNDFFGEAKAVQGLSFEGEDGLGFGVAGFGDGTGGGIALGDEDHGFRSQFVFGVEVDFAIAEFAVVEVGFFGAFVGDLFDAGDVFALAFALFDPLEEFFGDGLVFVEVVVEVVPDDVVDPGADHFALAAGFGVGGAEFGFGLGFEDGFLGADGDGADDGCPDVGGIEFFVVEFADGFDDGFAEGLLVGAALGGVLPVDEGVVLFAVGAAMGEGDFDFIFLEVDDGVAPFGFFGVEFEEIFEAIFGLEFFPVEDDGEAAVEEGVVPHHVLDVFRVEFVVFEDFRVGGEDGEGAVSHGVGGDGVVLGDFPFGEFGQFGFAVAVGLDLEGGGQGVDGFGTNSVQPDGFLEGVGVEFAPGVDLGDAIDDFAQRDPAPVIPDPDFLLGDGNFDRFPDSHHEFVDGVVDDFFQQDVDSIVGSGTIS